MTKQELLKKYFGHASFREGQEQIIDRLLDKQDVLCVMPTGAGKSICYQIPALMLPGITLVISPLISLMKDQVNALNQMGISAAYINSSLSPQEYGKTMRRAGNGDYKIIYVAPERLLTEEFLYFSKQTPISLIAVDEAHCVSQWGQDFRPSYTKIAQFISELPYRPMIGAFTATATQAVRQDISMFLELREPYMVTTGFDRKNLYFGVKAPKDKKAELLDILRENNDKNGIVYCATRKTVEEICSYLCLKGFSATKYHAGLEDAERTVNQDAFIYDQKQIMVATNAFGMGIDKSNVSYVVHYNMPKNLENYYQEAGRAGRDGEDAKCILLYSGADVKTNLFLIEKSEPDPELSAQEYQAIKEKDRERLKIMTFYCTTADCLRSFILKYFGEKSAHFCGNCSSCETNFETINITVEAQKILSCIIRIKQNYGVKMLVDILRGSKAERILKLGFNQLSTYGIMKEYSDKQIRSMVDYLAMEGYVTFTNTEYPVILLTAKASDVLKGNIELTMKLPKVIEKAKEEKEDIEYKSYPMSIDHGDDEQLLIKLKALRFEIAKRERVPAYIIFSDAALRDMCRRRPQNTDEFLNVSGVGHVKLEKYGKEFIQCISENC